VTSSDDKDERKVWQVLYGYVLAFIGVVSLTPSALFVVLVSDSGVDAFTIIFFQTLFAGSVFLLYTIATSTSLEKFFAKFLNIGLLGGLASILVAIEDLTFILAVLYANVANVYIILVCNPLVAAVLSNIFMGETLPWRTIITIAVCATAIGVAVGLDLSTDLDSEWFGTLMAALSTICFASYMVTMRVALSHKQSIGEPEIELSAVLVLGFFIVVLCTIIAGSTNHIKAMTDFDYMYMLLMGAVSAPVSMTCLSYATRYISATEVGIYLLLGMYNCEV
jgi:drug/metabolite transporter (DMT)-like permease